MENKTYQFKTNINCGGCIASLKPQLDNVKEITSWEVDTNNPNKILTVKTDKTTKEEVIEAVEKAGFKIEFLEA